MASRWHLFFALHIGGDVTLRLRGCRRHKSTGTYRVCLPAHCLLGSQLCYDVCPVGAAYQKVTHLDGANISDEVPQSKTA